MSDSMSSWQGGDRSKQVIFLWRLNVLEGLERSGRLVGKISSKMLMVPSYDQKTKGLGLYETNKAALKPSIVVGGVS